MTFQQQALDLARCGLKVLPLKPRDKRPIVAGGCNAGTTDADQVRLWWNKHPTANIGISCGLSNFLVMDADHGLTCYEEFIAWRDRNGLPPTYTIRSGRRFKSDGSPEYGVQMYYRGAITTQGRKTWKLDGVTGDFKSDGGLVVHPPSIHPDSGEAYEVICDVLIAARPEVLLTLSTADGRKTVAAQTNDEGLIEGNRNEDMCSFIGKVRKQVHSMSEAACLDLCRLRNEQYAKGPMEDDEVNKIVSGQYRLYPNVGPGPVVTIGGRRSSACAQEGEGIELVEELDQSLTATPLPTYPKTVFEGTLYLDFAKRASQGNYVPLEFFIEGAMTYAGAIAGDQLHGMAEEITPRLYTVFIAPPGIGKGTTFRRIRKFAPSIRLLNAVPEKFIPNCSALADRAGSENGLNDALLSCPRVIEEFEELDRMMEKTEIKGSGKALMSIIRTCFDDTVPGITTTAGRPVAASLAFLSLLGAITPSLWRSAMEGRDSYGSGLGGRFNLVASNEDRTASTLVSMQIGDLQDQLERKFVELESQHTTIPTEKDALKVLDDWWTANSRGKPHYNRVNVITHRKALHLAWIRGLPVITAEIMRQAIQLAEYLVAVRCAFAVAPGEDKTAICENRIMNLLRQISPKAVRPKQVVELLGCMASRNTVLRALESLASSGEAEKIVRKDSSSKKPYAVFRLNPK